MSVRPFFFIFLYLIFYYLVDFTETLQDNTVLDSDPHNRSVPDFAFSGHVIEKCGQKGTGLHSISSLITGHFQNLW